MGNCGGREEGPDDDAKKEWVKWKTSPDGAAALDKDKDDSALAAWRVLYKRLTRSAADESAPADAKCVVKSLTLVEHSPVTGSGWDFDVHYTFAVVHVHAEFNPLNDPNPQRWCVYKKKGNWNYMSGCNHPVEKRPAKKVVAKDDKAKAFFDACVLKRLGTDEKAAHEAWRLLYHKLTTRRNEDDDPKGCVVKKLHSVQSVEVTPALSAHFLFRVEHEHPELNEREDTDPIEWCIASADKSKPSEWVLQRACRHTSARESVFIPPSTGNGHTIKA